MGTNTETHKTRPTAVKCTVEPSSPPQHPKKSSTLLTITNFTDAKRMRKGKIRRHEKEKVIKIETKAELSNV